MGSGVVNVNVNVNGVKSTFDFHCSHAPVLERQIEGII